MSYTVDGKQMDFVGTLVGGFDFYTAAASKTALFLSSGQFWIAGPSTQSMKAFRAYFTYSDVSNSRFTLTFTDNETEGISESCYNNDSPDKVYDLQGRRVQEGQLKQGLYIRNGKKTIIR